MSEVTNDQDLMAAYVKGDEKAFSLLFDRYSSKLKLFLKLRLGKKNNHLLEEIFQKTWMKIHSARQSFDLSKRFSPWFYTVAANTLRDEVGRSQEKLGHEELSDHEVSLEPNSEDKYIQKESADRVYSILSALPENQRIALLLSDREEFSSKEISESMGISDAAVRKLISRARSNVRRILSEREAK